jgi:hypothetical protein
MKSSLTILSVALLSVFHTTAICEAKPQQTCPAAPTKATPEVCRQHIDTEEKSKGIEPGLLEAIAQIESKLTPYTVNASGYGHSFKTVDAAVQFIKTKQSEGCRNISVGPMQLHLPSHRRNFNSIESMLDPKKNISYAANLFAKLIRRTGSAEKAVKMYHSGTYHKGEAYKNRVFGAWAKIRKRKTNSPGSHQISAKKSLEMVENKALFEKKSTKKPIKIKFGIGASASKKD